LKRMVRQFECILANCDSFVTWANTKDEAVLECTVKVGKPVHVWPTGRKFRDSQNGMDDAARPEGKR
jgi:hypothetical protein